MIISDQENITKKHYDSVHRTLARYWTKTGVCEHCKGKAVTQWANKNGNYAINRSEWLELCIPCHVKYDKNRGLYRGRPKKSKD